MIARVLPTALLVATIVLQAMFPAHRLIVVLVGAALAGAGAVLTQTATMAELLAAIPWDVFILLVSLGVVAEVLARSRVFDLLAVRVAQASRARPDWLPPLFALVMFGVSGVVNNLTALLLVLPVLLVLLRLTGTTRRHLQWTVGAVIVCCNLGGAATPVGDFPAILLLGSGAMGFTEYLVLAFPAAVVGLVAVLAVIGLVARPARDVAFTDFSLRITLAVIGGLYRKARVHAAIAVPSLGILGLMGVGWVFLPSWGLSPELIAWAGATAALALVVALVRSPPGTPRPAMEVLERAFDPQTLVFLFCLFFMVGVVRRTGLFGALADALLALPLPPLGRLTVFLVTAGVLTGLFSAGPSMAALLEVARGLAGTLPPAAVYVGLAMSVCAGSSLFLTAATSGPLAQAMVERAGLKDAEGRLLRFGFAEFLPVGLVSFAIIQTVALVTGWWLAR